MQFLRSGGLFRGSLLRSAADVLSTSSSPTASLCFASRNLGFSTKATTVATNTSPRLMTMSGNYCCFSTKNAAHTVSLAAHQPKLLPFPSYNMMAFTRGPSSSPLLLSRSFHSQLRRRTTTSITTTTTSRIKNNWGPLSSSSSLMKNQLGVLSYLSSSSNFGRRPGGGGNRWAQGVGVVGAASLLLGKTKYVLAALKLTKLASLGSMLFTIGTYSMFFGLPYAAGMVGLIAIHECGHAIVMHQRGIPFSPMVFIPFLGASVAMNRMPRDAWEDAVIGYGGPALGSLGAGAVAVGAHMTDSQLLYALADFGFMINLFNLLPIGMMDGGRISGAISPYVGVAGLGLGGLLAYSGEIHNPIFYLILLAGGYETFMRFYDSTRLPPNYYRITPFQRGTVTVAYVGLIVALLAAMDANQRYRKPPEVLMRERDMEKSWDMR